MLTVNVQYISFFKNWLYYASEALDEHREQVVVMAESSNSIPLLRNMGGLYGIHFDVRFDDAWENQTKRFIHQDRWENVVTHRPRQILQLLEEGCSVLYQDVDTAWKEPLFPILDAAGHHDVLFSSDGLTDWRTLTPAHWYFCTCLMYFHPTDASKALVREWKKESETGL